MKKIKRSDLHLNSETIRTLRAPALTAARGGMPDEPSWPTCFVPCSNTDTVHSCDPTCSDNFTQECDFSRACGGGA